VALASFPSPCNRVVVSGCGRLATTAQRRVPASGWYPPIRGRYPPNRAPRVPGTSRVRGCGRYAHPTLHWGDGTTIECTVVGVICTQLDSGFGAAIECSVVGAIRTRGGLRNPGAKDPPCGGSRPVEGRAPASRLDPGIHMLSAWVTQATFPVAPLLRQGPSKRRPPRVALLAHPSRGANLESFPEASQRSSHCRVPAQRIAGPATPRRPGLFSFAHPLPTSLQPPSP
jgi:hypothetical protein